MSRQEEEEEEDFPPLYPGQGREDFNENNRNINTNNNRIDNNQFVEEKEDTDDPHFSRIVPLTRASPPPSSHSRPHNKPQYSRILADIRRVEESVRTSPSPASPHQNVTTIVPHLSSPPPFDPVDDFDPFDLVNRSPEKRLRSFTVDSRPLLDTSSTDEERLKLLSKVQVEEKQEKQEKRDRYQEQQEIDKKQKEKAQQRTQQFIKSEQKQKEREQKEREKTEKQKQTVLQIAQQKQEKEKNRERKEKREKEQRKRKTRKRREREERKRREREDRVGSA